MDETSKNKSTPCKGCERRCAGCHIKCADYAGYRQKLDSEAQRRARERASDPRYMSMPWTCLHFAKRCGARREWIEEVN